MIYVHDNKDGVCVCVTRMKMRVMMMIIMTEYFETDCRQQVKSSQYKYKYFHARVHTFRRKEELQKACIEGH